MKNILISNSVANSVWCKILIVAPALSLPTHVPLSLYCCVHCFHHDRSCPSLLSCPLTLSIAKSVPCLFHSPIICPFYTPPIYVPINLSIYYFIWPSIHPSLPQSYCFQKYPTTWNFFIRRAYSADALYNLMGFWFMVHALILLLWWC